MHTDPHADPVVQLFHGFHPRLGARPLRDAIEKRLRGAVVEATLAEVDLSSAELVICANELIAQPTGDN